MAASSKGFSENDRVSHQVHGVGTITSIYKGYTVINFDGPGRKTFVTEFLQVDHSDEPAPPPKKQRARARKP